MNLEIKTMELASVYEKQGHLKEAQQIYDALKKEGGPLENEAASGTGPDIEQIPVSEEESNIADLLEKWLMLLVVQRRLKTYKKIKSRLI